MKRNYFFILCAAAMISSVCCFGQAKQKNFINYQGVARDAESNLMEQEELNIGIGLRFGSATATILYEESHNITTDANGVFSLRIGEGNLVNGNYATLLWDGATFMTVWLNGIEVGTTELMAVPYAISSGDKQWELNGSDIENVNEGNVSVQNDFKVNGGFNLSVGNQVNEISDNGTLSENSNGILPTQRAVKTYVDNRFFSGGGIEQTAAEVPYDNTASGLVANNTQEAIDELAAGTGGADADADPANEIQDISLSGTDLSITDGSTIDLSAILPPGGTDDQNASEVPFDNTGTGLAAGDAQAAIEELAAAGLVDTDNQDLSLSGTTLQITDGASVDLSTIIPPGGTDDQEASEVPFDNTGTGLAAIDTQAAIEELAAGGLVDTDNQGLVLTGDVLSIEDGIGSVDLSDYFNRTTRHGLLVGDDGIVDGLVGTADGQVAKWDAALGNWVAGTDEVGGGGSSLWEENGDDIYFDSGNIGIGNLNPGTETGAGKYLTVATGTSPADNSFASIEIQGGQGTQNRPVGRLDFISNSAPGNSAIGRIESRTSSGAQFRGDLAFSTQEGDAFASRSLKERMTIKSNGNVGVGTINPTTKLDVNGDIKISGEMRRENTGTTDMLPIAYGYVDDNADILSGSGNFTVTNSGTGLYTITIPNEEDPENWTVLTTINHTVPAVASVSHFASGAKKFIVNTWSLNSTRSDFSFSFVVYKK